VLAGQSCIFFYLNPWLVVCSIKEVLPGPLASIVCLPGLLASIVCSIKEVLPGPLASIVCSIKEVLPGLLASSML
jgi:type IV secretory pathway VirB2 component (pilin)